MSSNDKNECPQCKITISVHDEKTGDIICQQCGIIIGKIIDPGQEWTEFDEKGRKQRRTGPPKGSLMTEVGKDFKDVYKNTAKGEQRPTLARLRKQQARATKQDPIHRNFERAESEAEAIISRLGMPHIIMTTFTNLYKKLLKKKYTRGRPTTKTVPALLFLICKIHKLPWKAKEIADDSTITTKQLWGSFSEIQQVLNIKTNFIEYKYFISTFSSELELPERILPLAVKIVEKTKKNLKKKGQYHLMGKDPKGVAAAGIYSACLLLMIDDETLYRTQKEIMEVANVSEPTLRKRWDAIKKNTDYFKSETDGNTDG